MQSIRRCLVAALLAPAALFTMSAAELAGQALHRVEGVVRDAETGEPIEDVLVRADSLGDVALTGSDGTFRLQRLFGGPQMLRFERLGYAADSLRIDVPVEDRLQIELRPRPVEVAGLRASAESFETRMRAVEDHLDRRMARLSGAARIADSRELRRYDALQAEDPWRFLSSAMGVRWAFEEGFVRVMGRTVRPEVYIDDRRRWLFQVVHAQLPRFCRMEVYEPPPPPNFDRVPTQIRAYTCEFMIRVADGKEEMKDYVTWGDLIAGPGQ